jgi:hypothetical protein
MNHHFRSVFGTSIPNTRAVPRLLLFSFIASLVLVLVPTADAQTIPTFTPNPLQNPICSKIGKQIQVSLGLRMFCFGQQPNGPGNGTSPATAQSSSGTTDHSTSIFSQNVNAASLAEDITPSSTRAYGQSETSIAASGSYVVEAWNDATGFFSPCPSPMYKEELTGAGFSKDGGNTFTDLGGLPNDDCANNRLFGDPSVEVFHAPNGTTYFYISSLYISLSFTDPTNKLALNVCTVSGTGTLNCGQPVVAAKSSECIPFYACSFLDKEFLTIDPVNKRLYMSYTEVGFSPATANGQIELAACDLTNPAMPVCENGSNGPSAVPASPYLVVAQGDANCEQEGAYPAVDRMTGDVYVAWEFNWATNALAGPPCNSTPTQNVLAYLASSCLGPAGPPAPTSSCAAPQPSTSVAITSMDLALIPGYNRSPMNDFPRIAVSDPAGTVSIVWNDAGRNPGGDILLQSFNLGISFTPTGLAPVKINNDNVLGTYHFLPALRNADSTGKISISWYDRRRNPNTALTDVFAAVAISPRITGTPTSNQRVTDTASDWLSVSSNITPNFGDYTDNYASPPPAFSTEDDPLFVAWSDGRLNVPQPFESHAPLPAPH